MDDSDFLNGAAEIGRFLNVSTRRCYYLLENKEIPARRLGSLWQARKSRILKHYEEGEAETLARGSDGEAA